MRIADIMLDRPLRLAVFDCDGTLVDSQKSIIESMQVAFSDSGFPEPGDDAVRRVVGLPLVESVARLLPQEDHGTHDRLSEGYKKVFQGLRLRGAVHEPLFPGVFETLGVLEDEGWLLGVATGKAHKGLVSTLKTHGLESRFVTMQTADRARGKPHPEMMLRAMEETGAEPLETVMIGDTTYDIEMARNAGVHAVGVAWGYHDSEDLDRAGAHLVVDAFADLSGAVRSLVEA